MENRERKMKNSHLEFLPAGKDFFLCRRCHGFPRMFLKSVFLGVYPCAKTVPVF